ncbi:MAG: hypothetical protein AAGC92_01595 [Pseudomonadota bacterium]
MQRRAWTGPTLWPAIPARPGPARHPAFGSGLAARLLVPLSRGTAEPADSHDRPAKHDTGDLLDGGSPLEPQRPRSVALMPVGIRRARPDEGRPHRRAFIAAAFGGIERCIGPPSFMHRKKPKPFAPATTASARFPAGDPARIDGLFAKSQGAALPFFMNTAKSAAHRQGVARALLYARKAKAPRESRVARTQTPAAFAALGLAVLGRTAHPGYEKPSSRMMRKQRPASSWQKYSNSPIGDAR